MEQVVSSNSQHLEATLGWLKREHDIKGEGFYWNREIICRAHDDGKLHILTSRYEEVAFLVSDDQSMLILAVQPDRREHGFGRQLAQFGIERIRDAGACIIRIECSPRTSIPFWKRMGFNLDQPDDPWCHHAHMFLEKTVALPEDHRNVEITVRLYAEAASYNRNDDIEPLREWSPKAVRLPPNDILLGQRIILFDPKIETGQDPVVEITVEGKRLVKVKAKRDEALHHGVEKAPCGSFHIEMIKNA